MAILGLDLATVTGYCKKSDAGSLHIGIIKTHKTKDPKQYNIGIRVQRLKEELVDLLGNVQAVGYERVFFNRGQGGIYWGMVCVVQMMCLKRNIPCFEFAVQTVKKRATGHGHAEKIGVIHAAADAEPSYTRLFYGKDGDNAADAYWIMRLTEEKVKDAL